MSTLKDNAKFQKLITQLNSTMDMDSLLSNPDFNEIIKVLESKGKMQILTTFIDYNIISHEQQIYNF